MKLFDRSSPLRKSPGKKAGALTAVVAAGILCAVLVNIGLTRL